MSRDESRDVYVQRDSDGNFVAIAAHLQSYEMYEEQDASDTIVRYVTHDQFEAAERDRDTAREAMEEFAKRAAVLLKERDEWRETYAQKVEYAQTDASVALGVQLNLAAAEKQLQEVREIVGAVAGTHTVEVVRARQTELEVANERVTELEAERDEILGTMAGLSSYLGAGLGDEQTTTMAQYLERIRWGVDHHTSVLESMIQSKNRRIEEFESLSKEWEPLRQWAKDDPKVALGKSCFVAALERIKSQESIIAQLELHIRNLAARIDGDGGQRQRGESIEKAVERVDAEFARLQKHPPRCKDGCENFGHAHRMIQNCPGGVAPNRDDFCSNHTRLKP